MYEGEGENSLSLNEDLFEELQSSLQKLVQVYTVSPRLANISLFMAYMCVGFLD